MELEGMSREAQVSIVASSMFPGFRFCPTDEELISYYLNKKLQGHEDSVQVISEVELCKFEPWDLPAKSFIKSVNEWFFFSPRGRKYPNGSQSKRATECGYWKATGKERNVKSGSDVIGTKRTLVFHLGRAPKGERTEWIMHEYCINDKSQDSLVVCRLKRNTDFRASDASNRASSSQMNNVNSHESDCAVSEGAIDQTGVCQQDKEVGSSNSSPSAEQIDSNESNQRPTNEAAFTESSCRPMVDEEDCYAEILKDDIIKLDDSSLSQEADTRPCQGTAQRRIRLRVRPEVGVSFGSSKHSSSSSKRNNTLFARMTKPLVLFGFLVLTLVAMFLFFKNCGVFSSSGVKLWLL